MREIWNSTGKYGIYGNVNGTMELILECPSIQSARSFIHKNWIEGEDMYLEIIDQMTGKVLCYFEDGEL